MLALRTELNPLTDTNSNLLSTVKVVVSVTQNFRLDDGDESIRLANGCVSETEISRILFRHNDSVLACEEVISNRVKGQPGYEDFSVIPVAECLRMGRWVRVGGVINVNQPG